MRHHPTAAVEYLTVLIAAVGFGIGTLFCSALAQSADPSAAMRISEELCRDMQAHHVLNPGAPVGCERLRLLKFGYVDFTGQTHDDGEMAVLDAISDQVLQIFAALQKQGFPIAEAKLMDKFDGDDDASMAENNTSAFNVRQIAGGGAVSLHAYGVAIDLNPMQSPYLKRVGDKVTVSPPAGVSYIDRKNHRSGMAESVIGLFAEHGLSVWGGYWG